MIPRPRFHALLLAAALLAPFPTAAHAGAAPKPTAPKETPLQRIQRSVARINAEARTPEGEAAVLRRLSAQLRVSEDQLRTERDAWAIGYGEVAMVHAFAGASRTGKSPADVAAMRHSGMEWQAIAKELGVKVDAVATRMRRHARGLAAPAPAR
jgi:hypothetical protein